MLGLSKGLSLPENPTWPNRFLAGLRVGFQVLFWVRIGVGSYKYVTSELDFFLFKNPTLCWSFSASLSYSPKSQSHKTSQSTLFCSIFTCVSHLFLCCSTKVCFLFQFFFVLGFVLVSGLLFVLLILGLEGCGLCVTFCSHYPIFSWLMGFCCFPYSRIESCGSLIMC